MELSPLSVYRTAVQAVPSLRYALAVAGAIAAAMIALNISNNDPRKAVLAFVFVLAGMYLLLVFAQISNLGDIIRGPVILIVWALTIMFVSCLGLTLSAFAIGQPDGWAELVGATPSAARISRSGPSDSLTVSVNSHGTSPPVVIEPPAPAPVTEPSTTLPYH